MSQVQAEVKPGWLKLCEAPRWCGIGLSSLERAAAQGKFVTKKAGKNTLIEVESLDAWIRSEEWLKPRGREQASKDDLGKTT